MSSLLPTLKFVESFTVTGLSTRTQNRDEFNEQTAKLPSLWQQFYASGLVTNATIFGVYSDYASDENGLYTVTAGVIYDKKNADFDSVKIQAGNYLLFQGLGPMPDAVIAAWQKVWAYFATEQQYQRNFVSDFESYSGEQEVIIYIGLK